MFKRSKRISERFVKIANTKKFEYFALFLILAGCFGVRLYKINNPLGDWHSWRQADTASVSRIYLDQGVNLLFPKYYDISVAQTGFFNPQGFRFVEFPIYNVLNVVLFRAFPKFSLEEWARLISIVSAVATTYIVYLIGRKYVGKWGGILSAFFYAFIPFNIYFTRVILPEPMTVFFGTLSVWLFSQYIDRNSKANLFASAFSFATAMLLKPYIIFYCLPMIYLAIKKFGIKNIFKQYSLLIAFDFALIPFLLWRIWMNNYPQGIPFFTWAFNGNNIRFRPAFWRWIFGERLGYLILGIWGLVPFIYAVLRKKNTFIKMFGLGMFLYVSVVATANIMHDYYQTLVVPAVALIVGSGTVMLWGAVEFNKWARRIAVVFCIGMMLGLGWYQIKENYKVNHPEIFEAGSAVDRLTPKDAKVIAPYNGDTAFLYQTHRFGWPIVDRSFDELIKMGASYYVSVNYDNDTNKLLAKYKAIQKTSSYVIIDLHQPLSMKK